MAGVAVLLCCCVALSTITRLHYERLPGLCRSVTISERQPLVFRPTRRIVTRWSEVIREQGESTVVHVEMTS